MARIAAGETLLMSQAVRVMLAATVAVNLLLVLITPVLLAVLFGRQFRDAYPMVLILLAAQIPLAGAQVLSSALQADGVPLIPTVGEGIAVVITVSGLAIALPALGGIGAAIVSVCAYGASFSFQVVMARRRTGIPFRQFLVPSRADATWARERFAAVTGALSFGH
jgi:O-antigen/teichoic acid export membrane protein